MTKPIWAPSNERGLKLQAANCPIDYLGALPCQSFRAEELAGYLSRIYALGPLETRYVIPIHFDTVDRLGKIITDVRFELPWLNHDIDWNCEPEEIIPPEHHNEYKSLFKSPVRKVLNDRFRIRRGHPVEGLLCGRSYQPIGESANGVISGKFIFTDDQGATVPLCIALNIDTGTYASLNRCMGPEDGHRGCRDVAGSRRRSRLGPLIQEMMLDEQPSALKQSGLDALETSKSKWGDGANPAGAGSESESRRRDAATRQGT